MLKHDRMVALLLLLSIMMAYPLAWLQVVEPVNGFQFLPLFSPAILVVLFLAACFYAWPRIWNNIIAMRYVLGYSAIFFLLSLVHLSGNLPFSWERYCASLTWVIIPFTFYLYAPEIGRILPLFMGVVWLGAMLVSLREYFSPPGILYGVPGNYNWNATLTAVAASFFLPWLYMRFRSWAWWRRLLIVSVPGILTVWIIYLCGSKGTWLGLAVALAGCGIAMMRKHRNWLIALVAAAGICGYLCLLLYPSLVEKVIRDDVRVSLWQGCSGLIRDHWLAGTSPAEFESVFAEYVPEEYYLNRHAASRHNHPHNEFLYMFAAWGIPAGLAWAAMVLYPLLALVLNRMFRTGGGNICLSVMPAAILLVGHGSLDLVLFEWPTNMLFFCLLGILWWRIWPLEDQSVSEKTPCCWRFAGVGACLLLAAGMTGYNAYASYFAWAGMRHFVAKDYVQAGASWARACELKSDPYILYRAATNAWPRLGDPATALRYYLRLPEIGARNYANNNGFAGQILLMQGKVADALPFLRQETVNFPLGVTGWYYLSRAQLLLGQKDEAAVSLQAMQRALSLKGLEARHLPFLLRNPYYDLNWRKIDARMLAEAGEHK